ncbi:MAG: 30S ribosomal protein S18 [candidate division FCPU426 bacterium]
MAFAKPKAKVKKKRASDDDRRYKRKSCRFCADKISSIDYKDSNRLRNFVTDRGKIVPRRITGNCSRHQHILTQAIKRSRNVGLLPFIAA